MRYESLMSTVVKPKPGHVCIPHVCTPRVRTSAKHKPIKTKNRKQEGMFSGPTSCPRFYSVIKGKNVEKYSVVLENFLEGAWFMYCSCLDYKLWHYKNVLKGIKIDKVILFFKFKSNCLWMNREIFSAMMTLVALRFVDNTVLPD